MTQRWGFARAGWFLLGVVVAPFLIVGLARAMPWAGDVFFALLVGVPLVGAATIWAVRPALRPLALGLAVGTALYVGSIAYLFATWDSIGP